MSKARLPGQLVRLTVRDYQLLREALVMADHERGGKMPEEWPEFDIMSNDRWAALDKIRKVFQIVKPARERLKNRALRK